MVATWRAVALARCCSMVVARACHQQVDRIWLVASFLHLPLHRLVLQQHHHCISIPNTRAWLKWESCAAVSGKWRAMGPHKPAPALAAVLDLSPYPALTKCRGILSTAPRQGKSKRELVNEMMALCQDVHLHARACRCLLASHKVATLRELLSKLRQQGLRVRPVGQRKDDLVNAIIASDWQGEGTAGLQCGGAARGVGPKRSCEAAGAAGSQKRTPPLAPAASRPRAASCRPEEEQCAGQGKGDMTTCSPDALPDGVLVAYGTAAEPLTLRRKLGKKWRKLGKSQRKFRNATRARRSKQLVQVLRESLDDHPSETIDAIRELVSQKTGISLTSPEQRLFFDRQLIKLTAHKPKQRRTRPRIILALSKVRPGS